LKRKWIVLLVTCLIGFGIFTTFHLRRSNASVNLNEELPDFGYTSKEKNQVFGYFMLNLYHFEIMNAFKEYYKDDRITGYRTPNPPHYDMVSIIPFEKGIHYKGFEKKYTYLLKIKLLPSYNNGKILGEDTLYFAVDPHRQTMKHQPKDYPAAAELVKYEHKKPPKKNN
jgi:hypothetical protein